MFYKLMLQVQFPELHGTPRISASAPTPNTELKKISNQTTCTRNNKKKYTAQYEKNPIRNLYKEHNSTFISDLLFIKHSRYVFLHNKANI